MKKYTDITVLVDRSGSMDRIQKAMESAYAEFIKAHAEVPSTRVTLIQFDTVDPQEVIYMDCPVKYADPLRIKPRGGTPLIDALVTAIDKTGSRLANKSEEDRPDQVLFVIITDGEENASRTNRRSDVESRVKKQTDQYKWQFIYLGANQDAIREAASFGIKKDWTLSYGYNAIDTQSAMRGITASTLAYTSSTNRNDSELLKMSESLRKKAKEEEQK